MYIFKSPCQISEHSTCVSVQRYHKLLTSACTVRPVSGNQSVSQGKDLNDLKAGGCLIQVNLLIKGGFGKKN